MNKEHSTEEVMSPLRPIGEKSKPRLTVLVGAGGSLEVGVPTTDDLTTAVCSQFEDPVDFPNYFATEGDDRRREQLLCAARHHYGKGANFEQLFEFIESGISLDRGWTRPGGIAEASWTQVRAPLADLFSSGDPFLPRCALMLELTVARAISATSEAAQSHLKWLAFKSFWTQLATSFDLTIATLNYDTLIEQALGWGGRQQGFEPREGSTGWICNRALVHERPAGRLFHLHGSIQMNGSVYGDSDKDLSSAGHFENKWYETIEAAQRASSGSLGGTAYGRQLLGGTLITGLHKTEKVSAEPFASYVEATANELRLSPRLLVIGYGFNDPHINRLIRRMNGAHGDNRRIACVDFVKLPDEIGSHRRIGFLTTMRLWAGRGFPWDDGIPRFEDLNGVWTSDKRTQLHFHGFLRAADRVQMIIKFLSDG